MAVHKVEQGDHLSSIAKQYGFELSDTIWDDGQNAKLKSERKNRYILYPGDEVFIPDKELKKESRATGATHEFKIKAEKLKLKMLLVDVNDKPRASEPCTLTIEAEAAKMTVKGDGTLEKRIARNARKGKLEMSDLEIPLLIGHLDPVDKQSGQAGRLNNLGYGAGHPNNPDPETFRSAVEEFQCDQSLPVTGDCDAATQDKLKSVHGC
jgi:hypothetical protein